MDELKNRILQLRTKISDQEAKDLKLRAGLKKAIAAVFKERKNPGDYIRDLYLREDKLTIFTKNKSFANEVFLRKQEILEKLSEDKEIKVSEITVK